MAVTPFHDIAAQLRALASDLESLADQAALGTLVYGEQPPAEPEPPAKETKK